MGFSTYAANKINDHSNGKTSWTMPSVWVALFTTATTDAGGGTEVTGGSYARKSTAGADWAASASGSSGNANTITFVTASASWGTVTHFATYDAATAGNMIRHGSLTTSKVVDSGDTVSFAAGALVANSD